MKSIIIFFVFIFFSIGLFGQKGKQPHHHKSEEITLGDKLFNNGDYYLAIQKYQKAMETFKDDPYVLHQLAESQRLIYDYLGAEQNYRNVVKYIDEKFSPTYHHDDYPLVRFRFASVLKANNKCEEAKKQFELFINHFKPSGIEDDTQYKNRALLEYNGCTLLSNEKDKVIRDFKLEILPEPINSSNSDYAPSVFLNDTVIGTTSARPSQKAKMYNPTGESFSDMYLYKKNVELWEDISSDKNFSNLNEILNEGSGCFSRSKTKYYFTRCDARHSASKGECLIYVSKLESEKWGIPKALNSNVNMPGFWSGQPALSYNGDTLFFVSKRPKGKGNHDIWYCTKTGENENWGTAQNLDKINTPFSEISPFYDFKDKILFFSSNGYESMGELDVFRTKDSTFSSVLNMGTPFNSPHDDFYYVLGEKFGYVASNREGGKGKDDIYIFNVISNEDIIAEIQKDSISNVNSIGVNGELKLLDRTTAASNVSVVVKDSSGNIIRKTLTDENGKFRFESLEGNKYYKVSLETKRKDVLAEVEYTVKDYKIRKSNKTASKASFEHVFFDFDDYKLRPEGKIVLDKLFEIIKRHPNLQIELNAYTDNFGPKDYNQKLSELRSIEAFNYLKSKGIDKTALVQGFGEDTPLASNENPIGRQLNRRLDFGIIGADTIKSFGMVYITGLNQNLKEIALKFGVAIDELRRMNGIDGDVLQNFRPIRIPNPDGENTICKQTIEMANGTEFNQYNKLYDNSNLNILENLGNIETKDGETFYSVMKGNTVYSIAKYFKMTPEELIQINNLDGFSLKLGQKLKVINKRESDE